MEVKRCEICGKECKGKRRDAKFCSDKCRDTNRRRKNQLAREAAKPVTPDAAEAAARRIQQVDSRRLRIVDPDETGLPAGLEVGQAPADEPEGNEVPGPAGFGVRAYVEDLRARGKLATPFLRARAALALTLAGNIDAGLPGFSAAASQVDRILHELAVQAGDISEDGPRSGSGFDWGEFMEEMSRPITPEVPREP